jgi:putative peptidoglycan lipid II flippase
VRLTLDAFVWHAAGLFFIALNRVVAPSFYAQGDSKSPTLAGILSFAVNVSLAVALVTPMRGGGIALALSLASAANTAILFVLLARKDTVDVARVLRAGALYALKILAISAVAVLPILALRAPLAARFAGHGRLVSQGIPLAASLAVFAAAGISLLALTRDELAMGFAGRSSESFRPKTGNSAGQSTSSRRPTSDDAELWALFLENRSIGNGSGYPRGPSSILSHTTAEISFSR